MQKINTDGIMRKLGLVMLRDFRVTFGPEYGKRQHELLMQTDLTAYRSYKAPGRSCVSPYLFKVEYQMESLYKRYRFEHDAYTDKDLLRISQDKFLDTQYRLNQPLEITPLVLRVLQRARANARLLLGEYSEDEHLSLCRFGKRACVGTPYRESYLDLKVENVTGSTEHIRWLREKLLPSDPLLQEVFGGIDAVNSRIKVCDTLNLTFVPKSYKALRSICPDTLVGTLYTSGLGRMVQKRLKSFGLDIARLQDKHRKLARAYSVTRECATADLSAASDSITVELLKWILPNRWSHAFLFGRIPYVNIGDTRIRMNTVMTMGLGHTFPLQTLVFYCLLKAIGELVGVQVRKISVYGDDLIYPSRMHKYVVHIFNKLQLLLNEDKTYVQDAFRESCGGDYYRGCDVRPFQPKGEFSLLGRRTYGAYLYRIYNGLRRRWELEDLPLTFEWLEAEIALSQDSVLQVPPFFPDDSGIKVERPVSGYLYEPVTWDCFKQRWVFQYLHRNSDNRVVKTQLPYYWERLREKRDSDWTPSWEDVVDTPVLKWIDSRCKRDNITPSQVILDIWKTMSNRERYEARHRRRMLPSVALKGSTKLVRQTGSTSCWT
jgi:hypothetical protein